MAVSEAEAVLDFWLDETPPAKRFAQDDALDAEIARRFGATHAQLAESLSSAWRDTPRAVLAAVIVLDQFSRNLNRGSAAAFAHDATARDLARAAIERGDDAGLSNDERQFLYMPLMHSESAEDQAASVALFATIGGEPHDFALAHQRVIARFGRFPHRNAALGRPSTRDEADYIARETDF